jgi:hypothetical protein
MLRTKHFLPRGIGDEDRKAPDWIIRRLLAAVLEQTGVLQEPNHALRSTAFDTHYSPITTGSPFQNSWGWIGQQL